jgi:replicative DNA helicase
MNELISKVYGLILTTNKADQLKLFEALRPEWNKTQFEKNLHSVIASLMDKSKDVNVMTVTLEFRERGLFTKEIMNKISLLANNLRSDEFLRVNNILGSLAYQNAVRTAKNASDKINQLIQSENFTVEQFNNIYEKALNSLKTNEKTDKSNAELIFEVLDRHNRRKKGEIFGIDLGFISLKNIVEIEDVDLMVIGARPAMGKTAFAVQVAINVGIKQNKKVAFFSLEMSAQQMIRRIIGNLANVDTLKIKNGECNADELQRIYMVQEMPELSNIKIFEGSHNIRQIGIEINEMQLNGGCDLFIIDYLQKVIPTSGKNRYEQVTQVSNGAKYLTQNLKIPGLALAQLNRESAKTGKLPTLPDLKESGEIEQDASIVGFLHRPEYYGEEITSNGTPAENVCEFILAKQREGNIGIYEMNVELKTSKFFD